MPAIADALGFHRSNHHHPQTCSRRRNVEPLPRRRKPLELGLPKRRSCSSSRTPGDRLVVDLVHRRPCCWNAEDERPTERWRGPTNLCGEADVVWNPGYPRSSPADRSTAAVDTTAGRSARVVVWEEIPARRKPRRSDPRGRGVSASPANLRHRRQTVRTRTGLRRASSGKHRWKSCQVGGTLSSWPRRAVTLAHRLPQGPGTRVRDGFCMLVVRTAPPVMAVGTSPKTWVLSSATVRLRALAMSAGVVPSARRLRKTLDSN